MVERADPSQYHPPRRSFVCRGCGNGLARNEIATHTCVIKTDPNLTHYALGPGITKCGATNGKENYFKDSPRVDCLDCRKLINKGAPK